MIDFLIVGQGIAGSVLSWELLKAGQRIQVINNRQANQASSVAAGMYNPITGRKLVKTWMADTLFPYLTRFYQDLEHQLQTRLLYPKRIFRPFSSASMRAHWLSTYADTAGPFVAEVVDNSFRSEHIHNPYGGLLLQQAGYVDVSKLLTSVRRHLQRRGLYQEGDFVYEALSLRRHVHYQDICARRVIFCEGPNVRYNPFFQTWPFRPVKGEVLTVQLQQPLDFIYNGPIYILPKAATETVVGASYDHTDLSLQPTERNRALLLSKLRQCVHLSHTVREQSVGIRPATFDRRPLISLHPTHSQVGIFNGMGTKGVSLAPYFAQVFVAHLLGQRPLPTEVTYRCPR
ncbi:MAG: FAD-dependent oxidoreductase [Bacteroidota bacterium]